LLSIGTLPVKQLCTVFESVSLLLYEVHKVNTYRGGGVCPSACMFHIWNLDFSKILCW